MKKKLLVLALVLVLVLSLSMALVACNPAEETEGKAPASELERAKDAVYRLYKDSIPQETAADFKVSTTVPLDGIYYFPITWTVSDSKITVSEPSNNQVTIDIPEESPEEINYTLTATITADDGTKATVEFERKVPKFVLFTWDEFVAAEDGTTVVIEGIVTAVLPYNNGATNRGVYMQTTDNKGAIYVYQPVEDGYDEIQVGMKVRATGEKDDYFGTLQIASGGSVQVVDKNKTTVEPKDYTAIYTAAADLKDPNLVAEASMLVTIKGVEIGAQGSDPTYYHFSLAGKESYIRISGSSCPLTTAEQKQFEEFFLANLGATADVTGLVTLYNGNFYLTPVSATPFTNVVTQEYTPEEMVARVKSQLSLTGNVAEATTLTLPVPALHKDEVTVTWSVSENTVGELKTEEGVQSFVIAKLPSEETTLTFTATIKCGEVEDTATFEVVVSGEYIAEDVEFIDLTGESLNLPGPYQDGIAGISGVKFEYTQLFLGENGMQFRFKDNVASGLKNTNAFAKGIVKIEITMNSGKTVYDNADVFSIKFGTSADELGNEIKLSTVADQLVYTVTPDKEGYTFFSIYKVLEQYTFYVDSIRIYFVDEITLSPADKVSEEKGDLKLDKTSYTQSGTATLPVVGATHNDVTITWASDNSAVAIDGANLTLTMPAASTRITLTATIACGDATDTKTFVIFAVVDVIDAMKLLESGESFEADYEFTGFVKEITSAYDPNYKNMELILTVGENEFKCFRLSGDAAATIKVGDEIIVTGNEVSNYNGTIELSYPTAVFAPAGEMTADEKVAAAKEALTLEKSYSADFTLPSEGLHGTTLTWTVKEENDYLSIDGYNVTITPGKTAQQVVIVATIALDGATNLTKEITVTVEELKVYLPEFVTEPAAGQYKLAVAQNNLGKTLYFTGAMDGFYLGTTENAGEAVDVTYEVAEGGFYLSFMVDGAKKYVEMYDRGEGKAGVQIVDTPTAVFVLDTKYNMLTAKFGDNTFYLGTYNTFDTLSASNVSFVNDDNVDKTQFPARLATLKVATDADLVQLDKDALELKTSYTDNFTLPAMGANGSTITWAVTEGTAIAIEGAEATVVRGDADATVKLTATIKLNDVTLTKEFTITVPKMSDGSEPTLATSIKVGDRIILANVEGKSELTSVTNDIGVRTQYDVVPAGTYVLEVVAGTAEGSFAFKTLDGQYLEFHGSSNKLYLSAELGDSSSWTVTFTDTNAKIVNVASTDRVLQYNSNSSQERFACYKGTQQDVNIFVVA